MRSSAAGYLAAILGIAAVTAICCLLRSHINEMTVALAMLLVVLVVASVWERWPALVASVLGMLCLNYFFLPPIDTLTIEDPKNWVALTAFFITALTAGGLSASVKQRAAEAEASNNQARLASVYNRSLLEASLDPLMTVGRDGKINDVNAAAETATGYARAELIGSGYPERFTEPEQARAVFEQVLRGGSLRAYSLELRRRGGHSTSVLCDGSLYRDADGNVIGVVLSARPISTYAGEPAEDRPDPRVLRHLGLFAAFAAVFPVAVGLLSILGLVFRIDLLKSVLPGQPVIKINAAACLVLLGMALWLVGRRDTVSRVKRLCARIMASATALVGLVSLTEHLFGRSFGIDQLLFHEPVADTFFSVRPGLIAPITALDFLLLGLAILLLDHPLSWQGRRFWPAPYLASLTMLLALAGLLDFILESHISYTHVALQTAITLFVVSLGVLCVRTEHGVAALLASSMPGGALMRRLLPAAIIIPIVIGVLSWTALSAGRYSAWNALAVMIIAMVALLSALAIWNGSIVNRGDLDSAQATAMLNRREMELRESQRLAHVGSWWWRPNTDSVIWSEGLSHLLWRDPMLPPPTYKENLGFYTPASSARIASAVERSVRTGSSFELDLEMVRADGANRFVTARGEAERDQDGNVVLVRGTVHDVTERKQAEQALQKSAEEILDLYNHAPCGYHSLDPDGVFVRINDTELEWLQYNRQELIGKRRFIDFLTPESLKIFESSFPQFKEKGSVQDLEFDLVRKDGTTFPVLLSASSVTDSSGKYLMSRSTVYDITARKREEQARAHLAAIVEYSDDAIVSKSLDGDIVTWNKGAERMFGYTAQEVAGRPISILAPADRLDELQAVMDKARHGESTEHLETVRLKKDGRPIFVSLTISPIRDADGEVVGAATISRDITERKRAEEALRRSNRAHRALSNCNQALVRTSDESTLLDQICRLIIDHAGYRFCWVGHAEQDETKAVKPLARAGFEDGYLATINITWADDERGRGPTGLAIRTGQIQITKDFATDTRLAPWRAEALKRGYASSVAIPLSVDGKVFGSLTIYSGEAEAFGDEEVKLLTELADDLGFGITGLHTQTERKRAEEEVRALNADLEQRVVRRTAQLQTANQELEQAHEREIETGFRIQQTLLLDQPPRDVPGLRVAALTIPSQRIDGDFYAFLRHSEDCLDVIVGDVMGKGIPAALLGAATKSHFLRALSDLVVASKDGALPEPKDIVMLAHAELAPHLMELDSFVTVMYARLNLSRRRLTVVDCGHTGILHWHSRTKRCEMLHGDNLPLGVRQDEIYNQVPYAFEPGDLLLLFSDGVTEARSPSGERFGVQRLEDYVQANGGLDPGRLVEGLRKAVFAFSGAEHVSDDLTSVAIGVEERLLPCVRSQIEMDSDLKTLGRARDFVREFCRGVPGPPLQEERAAFLELAVNEAASNIMKHAYHGRTDQRIHLDAEAYPDRIAVRLRHFGDPFDPSSVAPPPLDGSRESGFGAYIIGRCVDEVRYYRDERGRNCVALTVLRTPQQEGNSNGNRSAKL